MLGLTRMAASGAFLLLNAVSVFTLSWHGSCSRKIFTGALRPVWERFSDLQGRLADVVERIDVTARLAAGSKQFAVTLSTPLLRFHDETFLKLFVDLAEESLRHGPRQQSRADLDGGEMRRIWSPSHFTCC